MIKKPDVSWRAVNAFTAMGVGTQILYIIKNDLVIVNRWIEEDKVAKFVTAIIREYRFLISINR